MMGMNPRKMAQMMKQLGIQQQEINATEVIIRTPEKDLIIANPSVQKVNMMGQETFQVSGEITEQARSSTPEISEEDIKTVMEQTGASKEAAQKAIQGAEGDLAQAILSLKWNFYRGLWVTYEIPVILVGVPKQSWYKLTGESPVMVKPESHVAYPYLQ